jgi:putative ABC transport system permease protein
MGKWRRLWRRDRLDAAMDAEMRFHIEMEAERLVRERGLDPGEARRQALVAFGGVEKYKEEGRDTRRLAWLDALSLDARLGVRMLVKHRGLTIVGGFAMAVAIAVGAVSFEVISEVLDPSLPSKDGNRVVALQYATANPGSPERRVLHDFVEWRQQLSSVEQLGAFRSAQHNLGYGTAPPEPVKVAEMTASGFVVAGSPPLIGRYLLPDDERESAPPVVVIGYQEWQSRFAADRQIVGRAISLGGVAHNVVGVMPQGFGFPVDHQFWIPLRANRLTHERLRGPALYLFGRLAPGATMESAQAELTAIGQRTAASYPGEYERLRPLVLPYTREHLELEHPRIVLMLRLGQLLIGALCFVVAVNLAILTYARMVTRLGEFAVRTALGASRRRILAQVFIEALALSVVGAAAGLFLSKIALDSIQALIPANGAAPFWIDFDLSAPTVIYAFGLAALAAAIMGVVPGLKATGSRLSASLHELNVRTGARLGPLWTSLVVAQIAVAVAVLPVAVFMAAQMLRIEVEGPGFAAGKFVVGTVALSDDTSATDSSRVRTRQLELMSRLQDEPGVSAVAVSSSMPGFAPSRWIELEDAALRDEGSAEVSTLDVGIEMFDAYGAQMLAGRAFNTSDIGAANSVIVNRTFAQKLIGNRGALGLRFRYSRGQTSTPWYQIVGVVADFPAFSPAPGSDGEPTVYHPAAPGDVHPFTLSVRFGGDVPAGFIDRFRMLGAEVDPALQLRRAGRLAQFYDEQRALWRHMAWALAGLTASVLLLSAAGIYALMSFTVAQRTREIGIRAALGAAPHRLLFSIVGRVMRQLALGLLLGSLLSGAVFLSTDLGVGRASVILLTVAAMMTIVGLLAALGPARRGLRIQASEALRAE